MTSRQKRQRREDLSICFGLASILALVLVVAVPAIAYLAQA